MKFQIIYGAAIWAGHNGLPLKGNEELRESFSGLIVSWVIFAVGQ